MKASKKLKLHIALDSNQYISDRRFAKPFFSLLKALIRHDLLHIHIPWFVYKECTTRNQDEVERELMKAINSLESLEDMGAGAAFSKDIQKITKKLHTFKSKVPKSTEKNWTDFISESRATLHPFDPADSVQVFDGYFSAGKPFNALKARNDIPDAFIYQSLISISKDTLLHVVCKDDNLKKHLEEQSNIKCYKDLKEFFSSPEYEPINKEYERLEKYKALEKKLLLRSKEILEFFNQQIGSHEPFTAMHKKFPSYDNSATVFGLHEPEVRILNEEIIYADDIFFVPLLVYAQAEVSYFIFKDDYYLSHEHSKLNVAKWDEHFLLADETAPIAFVYKLQIPKRNVEEGTDLQIGLNLEEYSEIFVGIDKEDLDLLY